MRRTGFIALGALVLLMASVMLVEAAQGGTFAIPASVEDVVRSSDIIVLGRVIAKDKTGTEVGPMRQLVTRHTLKVEVYYKGSGPDDLDLMTLGGIELQKVGNETRPMITQAIGAEFVNQGEEILTFLRIGPGGYYFVAADGAKYIVKDDTGTGERQVDLRLRKKKYMRGIALRGFERLEAAEGGVGLGRGLEASLPLGKFQTEPIPVENLQARLSQIIEGESIPRQ